MTPATMIAGIVRVSKAIIWRTIPELTLRFYRRSRLRHESIVLLIHEGLGDLASMAPAIMEASREHEKVYVVARGKYFDAISVIFHFGSNVTNIRALEGKSKNYAISRRRILALKRYGYVIKIGHFDCDPIFRYPDSFYFKLGYRSHLASRKTRFNYIDFPNRQLEEFLKHVGGRFVLFSNETANGYLDTSRLDEIGPEYAIITCTSDPRIRKTDRMHDISTLDRKDFTRSLLNSLHACYLAEYVIVSDAGLFNILARLENTIDIRVLWRRHPHDLNWRIYGRYIGSRV